MYKVFLFDLGNVLAHPINDQDLYNKLHCKIDYEEFEKYWLENDLIIKAHMGLVSDEVSIKELLQYCKSDVTMEEFYKIYNDLDATLFLDTLKIIDCLKDKGYKVGLFSNLRLMDYNRYKEKIERIGFDYLFLSYEMHCIKPDDEIFKKVIQECDCNSDNIAFFDDNGRNVKAVKRNGLHCYQVTGHTIQEMFQSNFSI